MKKKTEGIMGHREIWNIIMAYLIYNYKIKLFKNSKEKIYLSS